MFTAGAVGIVVVNFPPDPLTVRNAKSKPFLDNAERISIISGESTFSSSV